MSEKSRQEIAFVQWSDNFLLLINRDKSIGADDRATIMAEMQDVLQYPVVRQNMIQAFSNFMWSMDETIERKVYDELEGLLDMIRKMVPNPEETGVLTIMAALTQIIAEGGKPLEPLDDSDVDELVSDDEVDDTKPAGLEAI